MILNKLSLFECFMHKTYKSVSKLKKLSFPIRTPFDYSLTQAILLVSLRIILPSVE